MGLSTDITIVSEPELCLLDSTAHSQVSACCPRARGGGGGGWGVCVCVWWGRGGGVFCSAAEMLQGAP